ncbi:hypothetical protein ACOMHN_022943 [Nucella lapillus]
MGKAAMHINRLPDNILLDILSYLSVKDRCVSGRVCRRWRKIVSDNSLWRHVDLLPYEVELRNLWKLVRAHLSDRLQILRVRGVLDPKTREVKPPLSESMMEEVCGRCPKLWWLHMEPGSITNFSSSVLLPSSLTHLTLRRCMWKPRWLEGCHLHFPQLVYLDLSDTVRVDNHDMEDVAKITNLHKLKLDNCYRLNEQGLQKIAQHLTQLTSLSLRGCDSSDLVVHHMSRHLTSLEDLDLSGSRLLTESSLAGLVEGLVSLKCLKVDSCIKLTVNAFSALCCSSSLRTVSLVLQDPGLSEDSVKPWREKMPLCTIVV